MDIKLKIYIDLDENFHSHYDGTTLYFKIFANVHKY